LGKLLYLSVSPLSHLLKKKKAGCGGTGCNASTREAEAGGYKFKASLDYVNCVSKRKKGGRKGGRKKGRRKRGGGGEEEEREDLSSSSLK
jgi:hypothetical protein